MPAVDTLAAPDTPTAVETAAVEETTAAVEETSAAVEEMTAATSLLCTGTFVPPLISTQRKRGRSQEEEEEDTDRDPPDEMASLKVRFKRLRTTRTGGHWYASSGEEDDARLDIELGLGMGKPAVAVTPPPWEMTMTSQTPTAASPKLPPAVRKSRRKRNI